MEILTINLLVLTSWSLGVCDQYAINFFHLVGVSVSAKPLKEMAQDIINIHDP